MNSHETFDIGIIGGGIVGLATAKALTDSGVTEVVLLEAEATLAYHQTGHNSGVIHSGLYYKPGSLKAKNCVAGREAIYRFCQEHGVAHERCGKVVVAVTEEERPYLVELERRGTENGLQGLRRLTRDELRELEPHADGVAGLHVPDTGIVDFIGVARAYADTAKRQGALIRPGARVTAVDRDGSCLRLSTAAGEVNVRNLINCGGLQSDRVARMCGMEPDIQIIPFRGEYYKLLPEREGLCRNLIYPVPDPRFPFLGVHFTRMVEGGVEVGPNAVLAFKREGYVRFSFSLGDTWDTFRHPGFWKMARRYSRTGCLEFYRSFSRRAFVKALQELVPDVGYDDVERHGAGVRAQAVTNDGTLVDDFRILEAEHMVHVLNAPSPAATASLSIGETIANMARKNFKLG